jgi:hypothetical protein
MFKIYLVTEQSVLWQSASNQQKSGLNPADAADCGMIF